MNPCLSELRHYDKDQSGTLDLQEMKQLVTELDLNLKSEVGRFKLDPGLKAPGFESST